VLCKHKQQGGSGGVGMLLGEGHVAKCAERPHHVRTAQHAERGRRLSTNMRRSGPPSGLCQQPSVHAHALSTCRLIMAC
jgi:hypothetical protein